MSDGDEAEVVDVEPVDMRQVLKHWRSDTDPVDLLVRIASECRISRREISRLTGLDRATVRRMLRSQKS